MQQTQSSIIHERREGNERGSATPSGMTDGQIRLTLSTADIQSVVSIGLLGELQNHMDI
jgi:hypothetical protein